MAKKEVRTDLWVYDMLTQAGISFDAQGSTVKEVHDALKTASKKGTGNTGFRNTPASSRIIYSSSKTKPISQSISSGMKREISALRSPQSQTML